MLHTKYICEKCGNGNNLQIVKIAVLKEAEDYDDYENWKENFTWQLIKTDSEWYYIPVFKPFDFIHMVWCIFCKTGDYIYEIPKTNQAKFRSYCRQKCLPIYEMNKETLNGYKGAFTIVDTLEIVNNINIPIQTCTWGRKIAVYPSI